MKKTILIFFLIINLFAVSQPITFNKIYNPYNKNTFSIGGGIQKKGNGYITFAAAGDTLNGNFQNVLLNEIDSIGNLIKIISLASDSFDYYAGNFGSLIQTSDGGYFLPCSKRYSSNNSDHYLIRFDANMDTLWTKTIDHDSVWEIYYQPCETYDKGFACVGLRVITSTLYDVLLAKFDSLGNKLWEKTISLGNYSVGGEIKETPDKGLLICGYKFSDDDYSGDPFVIKTDSVGNMLWYRIFGTPNQVDGGAAIAITSQGDYIVALGYTTYTFPWPSNNYWIGQLNVLKLNSNGNTIWNKMLDTITLGYSANKIEMINDNEFIIMGASLAITHTGFNASFLFKLNINGDSLSKKTYYYSDNLHDENIFRDFVINADKSITAIGMLIADTMNPRQRIWMVKTDSNLYAPGCYPTGVEEYITQKDGSISVFPNPVADDNLTITYSFSDIYKEIHLFINDASGRLVYQSTLYNTKGQHKLSVKDFASGSYICSFYNNDKLLNSVKFIKK